MFNLTSIQCFILAAQFFFLSPFSSCQDTQGTLDIGSTKLFYKSMGSGSPCIIFDTGFGNSYTEWIQIAEAVSKNTRVFLYDRAGYGQSDPGQFPRTCRQVSEELKALLDSAHIPPPYILVGHSLGGMNIQYFAARYPDLVYGIVVLDPPPIDWLTGDIFPDLRKFAEELTGSLKSDYELMMNSDKESDRIKSRYIRTLYSEHNEMFGTSAQQISEIKSFGSIPVTVIASGKPNDYFGKDAEEFQDFWNEQCRRIADRSDSGKYVLAAESSHYIHKDAPGKVIAEIKNLLR